MLWRSTLVVLLCAAGASAQRLSELEVPRPLPPGSALVVGFLGGFEPWNDSERAVRKLVLRLRSEHVYAESVRNQRRKIALKLIKAALDANGDRKLGPEEKSSARLVLVGQSWGGAAAVSVARDLAKIGVPVLLTVQVDSVGRRDGIIPPNVAEAVNFFQHDPLTITGQREIRAQDPSRTRILGNFQRFYLGLPTPDPNSSWLRRTFGGGHARMEMDPSVWMQAETYIRLALARN